MFKCSVCQKIYNTKVQYCECGNDEFDFVQEYTPSSVQKSYSGGDIVSFGIFSVCIILSILVLIFFNPIKPRHKTFKPSEVPEVTTSNIPDINSIWNDTPAYIPIQESGTPMEVYKKSLQNLLNSNIQPKQFDGIGRCEIAFSVNSNGKLVNRKMYKGEGSSKFNKIVLNMLKNTNEHRVPPSDYLGEMIKGDVVVQDGLIKLYIK